VDEVVIYNDGTAPMTDQGGISEPNEFLAHVLQFLETPQYFPLLMAVVDIDIYALISSLSILTYDTQDSSNQWT
jgi:predicted SPOUT superfamily RNA methylase MTH1